MSRRLRVLTIGHSYCVALNRAIVREVARDPDFDVTVAAPSFFQGDLRPIVIEPEQAETPLRLVGLPTRFTRFVHIFRYQDSALRRLIREGDFDVVHAWEEPYIFAGYQIARALKDNPARFCFRTAQSYVKRYPPPFNHFERTVLARAQGWIAGASLVREAMLQRGFPAETGRVLNLAVDLSQFRPLSEDQRTEIARQLGLQPPVIGFLGRLTRAKGLDILMGAMDLVGAAQPWSLLLLGSGAYQDKVLAWAAKRKWSSRVKILLAKHVDVPRYLGCMDLLVAPSQTMKNWREQFGRMIIEAFGCGVPVVGSDSGEIPFVIGDAGRVVAENDTVAWARTIEELLASPEARDQLRNRGLARAPRYSVVSTAQQYREYYRWLAERKVGSSVVQSALNTASEPSVTPDGPHQALSD